MKYICADSIMLNTKGPNQSFGNHLLHFYACWKISKSLGIGISINCDSNLDDLLILDDLKNRANQEPSLLYTEKHGGGIEEHVFKEIQNNDFFVDLLSGKIELPKSFYMEGWFWNSIFLPDESIFDEIKIKPELVDMVRNKYGYVNLETTLVIHYRGTDFIDHSIGWGDLRLKSEYYEKCISDFSKENVIKKIIIVSDECPVFLHDLGNRFCSDVLHTNNDYLIDWLVLLYSKNLVCSNSSFCYTAGWYRKKIVYQPNQFFTRYIETDLHYPVFTYYSKPNTKKI